MLGISREDANMDGEIQMTTIEITKLKTIRQSYGPDYTYLYTDLPNGIWPFHGVATLKLEVAKGTAEDYCKRHFPDIEHEVIVVP